MLINSTPSSAQIKEERKALGVSPLPKKRPRTLTLPLDDSAQPDRGFQDILRSLVGRISSVPQRTSSQEKSPLIARLPTEVRWLVWKFLLCGQHLHIVRAKKRLLAIRCEEESRLEPNLDTCSHLCWGVTTYDGRIHTPMAGYYERRKDNDNCDYASLLPVLQTCRFIYTETVSLIYEKNMFDFDNIDTLNGFSRTVLKPRMNLIRVLRLQHGFPDHASLAGTSWEFTHPKKYTMPAPYNPKTWEDTCRLLAGLVGLEELYMHLGGWIRYLSWTPGRREADPVLNPLLLVRQTKIFDVCVPWEVDPSTIYEAEDAPFRLITRAKCACSPW